MSSKKVLSWAYFLYENSDSDLELMKASIHCAVRNAWIISCWKCVQCLTLTHGVTFNHFHLIFFVNGVYNLCLRVSALIHVSCQCGTSDLRVSVLFGALCVLHAFY